MVLLTEQDSYYEALRANGFKVVDERDGSEFVVKPEHLIVVKSVGEYEALHPDAPPQLVFGTMQMGKKTERWGMVQPLSGEKVGPVFYAVVCVNNEINPNAGMHMYVYR